MSIEQQMERLAKVNSDLNIQNLIAQANARYILLNTSEDKANFPNYTIKDDNLNILALYYLGIGCSLSENQRLDEAKDPLERGAAILEFIHGAESNKNEISNYYGLISALSYYASFQYSKAFILVNKLEPNTLISRLISLFLKKDYNTLLEQIAEIVIDETYSDNYIANNDEESTGDLKIYEMILAKALDGFVKYFRTGNEELLKKAKRNLNALKEISEIKGDPGIWWIIRLLLIISDGFAVASLWEALKKHFDITNDTVRKYIYALIYNIPTSISELFITQRKSLEMVLDRGNKGCVVSIPTSSGKTRIAEISILNCLLADDNAKVLYIAPFRSLAFEIENSLDKIFRNAGIEVSHLYGGSLYNKQDERVIEDSRVIIATPEKAKAIYRGDRDALDQIKLIIIDEGHLLGPKKRDITNEIFYEELRYFIEHNNGKFLLLSAVLPNSEDLAQWLTESREAVYPDTWRPSDERLGVLEWTGETVSLNWESNDTERASFNRNFVSQRLIPKTGKQRNDRYFPSDKNEAVAATAFKLRTFGPVLIYVGRTDSAFVMAKAYMKNWENEPEDFTWKNSNDWKAFELACVEIYGDNNEWLSNAKKGVLCHNAKLHADVRLPLERLMRNDKPLVIIATSTLGQGVNLGVSTVIFSTLSQGGDDLSYRDFWNIAGRAGRAFIDHEGKILVSLDTSDRGSAKSRGRIKWNKEKISKYFDKANIDKAKSGILLLIKALKIIARRGGVSFDRLIELTAENKTSEINQDAIGIDDALDWIDDALLALHVFHNTKEEASFAWIEDFFRKSLAYIQAENEEDISGNEVLAFISHRITGIIRKVGTDRNTWQSLISSGIPLNSDLMLEEKLDGLYQMIQIFIQTERLVDDKVVLLKTIEETLLDLPVLRSVNLVSKDRDSIRELWIKGVPLSSISLKENAIEIINSIYSYNLPWILNGISKKMKKRDWEEESAILDELAVLSETGLPNIRSVKIYQAGIRSRAAATEISGLFVDDERSSKEYKRDIIANKDDYKLVLSEASGDWIDLLDSFTVTKQISLKRLVDFKYDVAGATSVLIPMIINGSPYLASPDLSFVQDVSTSELDFPSVSNAPGVFFEFDNFTESWEMKCDNPYITIR